MKIITPTSTILPVLGDRKINLMIFLLLILSPAVGAQPWVNNNNNNSRSYTFSPSMAIIIVVLVAALFFMAFFSIYIRRCSGNNGNTIRNALSMHARRGNMAARGLDADVIETFPTFSYAEVKDHKVGKGALECAVCLNEFEDDETLRLIPKCDHVFHPECIDAWLESHVTCPVCRTDLTPQPDEPSYLIPHPNQETRDNNDNIEQHLRNDDVSIQVSDDQALEGIAEDNKDPPPPVKRSSSLKFPTRPPRTESVRRGRTGFGRFRSHSTGHSLVQPGENVDRFTLRLPEELRKEMMNRAYLNRTKSHAMGLPRDASSRRGNRTGVNDGSSIGGFIRSFSRVERSDRAAKSDRWAFSKAPPFFTRAVSTTDTAENGEGSTSSKSGRTAVKMPSFKCLEPKCSDEAVLVHSDSVRPPV